MPKFRVLVDKQFGEGWGTGDIVEMDWPAAKKRVELGHIELCECDAPKEITTDKSNIDVEPVTDIYDKSGVTKEIAVEVFKEAHKVLEELLPKTIMFLS